MDDDRYPRRPVTVVANATANVIRLSGVRVGKDEMRFVGAAGGAGSLVVIINADADYFPIPLTAVAS